MRQLREERDRLLEESDEEEEAAEEERDELKGPHEEVEGFGG